MFESAEFLFKIITDLDVQIIIIRYRTGLALSVRLKEHITSLKKNERRKSEDLFHGIAFAHHRIVFGHQFDEISDVTLIHREKRTD